MTNSSNLNIVDLAAYGYLSFPLLLFIVGWIWLPLALLLVAAFLLVSWKTLRPSFQGGTDVFLPYKKAWRESVALACMFALILFMAGLTGNWQQHSDFPVRNDIFHNLVAESWPPQLQDGRYFIYYFQAWLPASLAGKVVGWEAAQWVYWLWCLLGMYLILHYIFRTLGKVTFIAGALFLVWNGLEFLPGVLLQHGLGAGSWEGLIKLNNHILDPFAPFGPAFSVRSIIHHFLPIALICGLVLQRDILRKWGPFLGVAALMYSPIAAMFLLPILVYLYLDLFFVLERREEREGEGQKEGGMKNLLACLCSPLSCVSYIIAALVIVPYYLSASQASPLNWGQLNGRSVGLLFYFLFFHAGLCAILIRTGCRKRLLWVTLLSLVLCMVASAVVNTEMSMKGSSVSNYYLFILFCCAWQKAPRTCRKWFIIYGGGVCVYLLNLHGAAASLLVGAAVLFLLRQRVWLGASLVGCLVAVLALLYHLRPERFSEIENKLAGRRALYSKTVRIYQPDGGSGKWWWYKTFPQKEDMPPWFRR